MTRISHEEYRALVAESAAKGRNKFGAVRERLCLACGRGCEGKAKRCTACGGPVHVFDSRKEARRFLHLRALDRAGAIRGLKVQVPYRLEIDGELVTTYLADFTYEEWEGGSWHPVVEDTKGGKVTETPVFKLKARLMKLLLGIDVRTI